MRAEKWYVKKIWNGKKKREKESQNYRMISFVSLKINLQPTHLLSHFSIIKIHHYLLLKNIISSFDTIIRAFDLLQNSSLRFLQFKIHQAPWNTRVHPRQLRLLYTTIDVFKFVKTRHPICLIAHLFQFKPRVFSYICHIVRLSEHLFRFLDP